MEYCGYVGRILFVDLTSGKVSTEPLDLALAEKLIGGFGISQKLAYDLLKPGIDPLSPENPVIICAGPLIGTPAPSSAKIQLTTKSATPGNPEETRYVVGSGCGGSNRFGFMLKNAGYDHLVITGRAERPVYLKIVDDDVELCDASDLWGKMDIYETSDELVRRHGRSGTWALGRAGERLAAVAHGIVDKRNSLGRNGGATVMGSKNVKAIVVRGTKGMKVADQRRLRALVRKTNEEISKHPDFLEESTRGGWLIGPKWAQYYPIEIFFNTLVGRRGCTGCLFACRTLLEVPDGEFAGAIYQTSQAMNIPVYGRRLELTDYRQMMKLVDMINRLGLDFMTTVGMLRFVTLLYERGVISGEDTGGLELRMGDFHAYAALIEKMASREDIGEAMASGWYPLSKAVGVNAWEDEAGDGIAKGTSTLYDARFTSVDPTRFANVVNPRGGHHLHGGTYHPGLSVEQVKEWFRSQAVPEEALERIFTEDNFNCGRLERHVEDGEAVLFSLGICVMPFTAGIVTLADLADYYSAITGIEVSAAELRERGERVWNLYKVVNVREGFTRADDVFPELWAKITDNPIQSSRGPITLRDYYSNPLTRDDLHRMIDDYYDERGWDVSTGIPTRQKLSDLGLGEYAEWGA